MSLNPRFLPGIWHYAHIIYYKTYANIRAEIEKTYLGCLWWVFEPMLQTAVFYIVFTQFLKMRSAEFSLFLYVGLTIYNYFSNIITAGSASLMQNAELMRQIYLPKPLFVCITVANMTWKFLFSFLSLVLLLWIRGHHPSLPYLALPFIFLFQILTVVGITLPLAAILPFFRDGRTIIATIVTIGPWFSAIFYIPSKIPGLLGKLLYFNPLVPLVEAYRSILLDRQWPHLLHFLPALAVTIFLWIVGLISMQRIDQEIAKINT